jgi:hypothetical protein
MKRDFKAATTLAAFGAVFISAAPCQAQRMAGGYNSVSAT